MVGSSDSYTVLKIKLENLPKNVVIIGSHTQMDSRKEKVRSSLFYSVGLFIYGLLNYCYPFDVDNFVFFRPILVDFYLQSLGATRLLCLILLFRYANLCHSFSLLPFSTLEVLYTTWVHVCFHVWVSKRALEYNFCL
jgi:hypothetical protein